MDWFNQIRTLDYILNGLIVGIMVSAPMGPVGILCIQRTLKKGRVYGFVTGLGAALSDMMYALITGAGMSVVMNLIETPQTMFFLKCVGSVLLLIFGIYCFRSKPDTETKRATGSKGTLLHNFVTGFLLTVSNVLIIFLFIALFARFPIQIPDHPEQQFLGYVSVWVGAVCWWFLLTFVIDKFRAKFEMRGIKILNRTIGIVVIVASIVSLFGIITGREFYLIH
jgi:threonine/homoserine/homoserine lactone efflux protein